MSRPSLHQGAARSRRTRSSGSWASSSIQRWDTSDPISAPLLQGRAGCGPRQLPRAVRADQSLRATSTGPADPIPMTSGRRSSRSRRLTNEFRTYLVAGSYLADPKFAPAAYESREWADFVLVSPNARPLLEPKDTAMTDIDRRTFLTGLSAASALTIVPRRVLGGQGYVAPSDMIRLAQVGCGPQSQRQVNTGFVKRPDVQFVAVVDPNRDSQDYVDWNESGNRNQIRRFLEEPTGAPPTRGSAAGVTSRARSWRPTTGSSSVREAFAPTKTTARCSRRRPTSRASSTSRLIISTGTSTSPRSRRESGDLAQAGRERTLRGAANAAGRRESTAVSHLLAYSNNADRHTLAAWISRA